MSQLSHDVYTAVTTNTYNSDDDFSMCTSVSDSDDNDHLDNDTITKEHFLHNLSLFYLRLQAKCLLPATVIQSIITEFQDVHDIGQHCLFNSLRKKLIIVGVSEQSANKITNELLQENLLHAFNSGILRSDQTRSSFFKSHFTYVAHKQIYLCI